MSLEFMADTPTFVSKLDNDGYLPISYLTSQKSIKDSKLDNNTIIGIIRSIDCRCLQTTRAFGSPFLLLEKHSFSVTFQTMSRNHASVTCFLGSRWSASRRRSRILGSLPSTQKNLHYGPFPLFKNPPFQVNR